MEDITNMTMPPMPKDASTSPSKRILSFYLAGSIKKDHEPTNELFWSDLEMRCLKDNLKDFDVSFLNPASRSDDLTDQLSVFGRDMTQVFCSDAVIVDLRQRRGLGVGAEMMWAKANAIPLLCYAPHDTHYSRSKTSLLGVEVDNWVHPFVASLSDVLVTNLVDAASWIRTHFLQTPYPVKGLEFVREAMAYYRQNQYAHDLPMRELIEASASLKIKLERTASEPFVKDSETISSGRN